MKSPLIFLICLIVFIIIIPFVHSSEINLEYPLEVQTQNITFNLELLDFAIGNYDIKLDLFYEEKRISKIWDEKWKSTMYYLNKIISSGEQKSFLINVGNFTGVAEIIIKVRDVKGKITTFNNYSIKIDSNKVVDKEEEIILDDFEEILEEKNDKESKEKKLDFEEKVYEPPVYDSIILNPKTIKTQENSHKQEQAYIKYSIFGFCILLFFLYITKSKKRKNEFRN